MTTTEPLPARHCIARVIELNGWIVSVEEVERHSECYHSIIAHARTLEEYGYQPPPPPLDPIKERAREICAEVCASTWPSAAKDYVDGKCDNTTLMRVAEKALREPRL